MIVLKTALGIPLFIENIVSLDVSEENSYFNDEMELETGYAVLAKTVSNESLQASFVYEDKVDAVAARDYIITNQLSATVIQI